LQDYVANGYPLEYCLVNLEAHDWLEKVQPYDLVLWKPNHMGPLAASHLKERIYVLERYLKKLVVPNYNTIWHFESKVAQSYLFALQQVPTPATVVSFDPENAAERLEQGRMPLVFKRSEGAASKHVRLVRSIRQGMRLWRKAFCGRQYRQCRAGGGPRWKTILKIGLQRWFWEFLAHYWRDREPAGYLYWQEYIPDNRADLRITVIGDCYAYGFWRNNRPGDFRASGSGRIDLERSVPEEPLRYCLQLNRRLGFDSMAYDILFRGNQFCISEMSYAYLDSVPYRAAGHYELRNDGAIDFVRGHVWPQSLWVAWAIHKAAGCRRQIPCE
jgi:glutathione synthase/RimK-type ligase-like ATP-grasp enzyme